MQLARSRRPIEAGFARAMSVLLLLVISVPQGTSPSSAQAASKPSDPFRHRLIAEQVLVRHIQPGVDRFRDDTAMLVDATSRCKKKPDFDGGSLAVPFREVVIAWGGIAHLTFGPLAENNRYDRVFFWLDRKGIARRQVARAMRQKPDAYLSARELGRRSIGVQGLSAFELVIARAKAGRDDATFRCGYLTAIARNLHRIAGAVSASWADGGEWAELWRSPGPKNRAYLRAKEPVFRIARSYLEHIERLREVELLRPLGLTRTRRSLPGPFARSDLTMRFIAARIAALRNALEASGFLDEAIRVAKAAAKTSTDRSNRDIMDQESAKRTVAALAQMRFDLRFAADLSRKLAAVPDFFASEKRYDAIGLGFPLKAARMRAMETFARTTGLPLGFNAADGD
ncbi:MAG: imelysin family protein [Pseudomonadota bacterium]